MSRIFLIFFVFMMVACKVTGQSTYLPFGSEEIHLLNKLEARSGVFSDRLFLDNPAVSRQDLFDYLNSQKSDLFMNRSNVDNFNINRALSLSGENGYNSDEAKYSEHPILNTFYTRETDLLRFSRQNIFLSVNPVVGVQSTLGNQDQGFLFNTSAGLEMRAQLKNIVGIYTFVTHNFEQPVQYQKDWINQWSAIPGAGHYQTLTDAHSGIYGYEYWKIRAYAELPLIRNHISLTAGYDQHFIGEGIRSLFLSNYAEGAWFASLNTKIWKLNYRNIFLRLEPQNFPGETPTIGNKYAAIHHLSVNVLPWFNVGLFESVTFSRPGGYEFGYLNPIIFYRAMERSLGSPDKVAIGIDAHAIPIKGIKIYSQFLINEFTSKEFFSHNGYWANKWALQLGAKYFNVFSIPNLDLQMEMNLIRPYTYTHTNRVAGESLSNFTHFNQALAHPLGAGLGELLTVIRYQPFPKALIELRGLYYEQGEDSASSNFGNNIFKDYQTRSSNYGVHLINGPRQKVMMGTANLSYELKPRLFLDLGISLRTVSSQIWFYPYADEMIYKAGFRLNLNRNYREF